MDGGREGRGRSEREGVLRCAVRGRNASGICPQPIAKSLACALRSHRRCAFQISIDPPTLSRRPPRPALSPRSHSVSRAVTSDTQLRHRAAVRHRSVDAPYIPPASSSSSSRRSRSTASSDRSRARLLAFSSASRSAGTDSPLPVIPAAHPLRLAFTSSACTCTCPCGTSYWLVNMLLSSVPPRSWLSGSVLVRVFARVAVILTQRLPTTTCPSRRLLLCRPARATALRAIYVPPFFPV